MFFLTHAVSSFFAWLLRQPYGGVMTGVIIGLIAAGLAAIFWYAWRRRQHEISEMERLSHKRGWAFRKSPMPGVAYSIEGWWKDGSSWSVLGGSARDDNTCFDFLIVRSGTISANSKPAAWILSERAVDLSSPLTAASSASARVRSRIELDARFIQVSAEAGGGLGLVLIADPALNLLEDSEFGHWLTNSADSLVNRKHAASHIVIRADEIGVHLTLEQADIDESTLEGLVAGAGFVKAAHSRARSKTASSWSGQRLAA